MNGILLVDKPIGPTSFDVVKAVRRAMGVRKVGHAGTLDPLASGLLIVCIGQGTRLVPYLMDSEKRYLTTVALGTQTDTDDSTGREIAEAPVPTIDKESLATILEGFTGVLSQVPPRFSALKKDGEAMYKKARRGEDIAPEPRNVTIHSISITSLSPTEIGLDIRCGKGTYIRSLARDLARALGTEGHLSALRRTFTSGFDVVDAVHMDHLDKMAGQGELRSKIISPTDALHTYPQVEILPEDQLFVSDGRPIDAGNYEAIGEINSEGIVCLTREDGHLLAIARLDDGRLKMERVFK